MFVNRFHILDFLKIVMFVIILFLLIPYINILKIAFQGKSDYLGFLYKNGILYEYIMCTIELILKVGILSSFIGFFGAYFMVFYSFRFKKIINVLFILPLSIPLYVGAYVYSDIYNNNSILEFLLKNNFTMNSTVFIYSIFLYPYVYLMVYPYLNNYMQEYIEVGNTLGFSNVQILYKIILPLTKSVIFSSSLFVIYESLSDFSVSEYYGANTLSKIFNDSWRVSSDQTTSAKLGLILLFILMIIILVEKYLKNRARFYEKCKRKSKYINCSIKEKTLIYTFFTFIITLGFILPVKKLLIGSIRYKMYFYNTDLLIAFSNTFLVAFISIFFILIISMFLSSMIKYLNNFIKGILHTVSTLGYMVPSLILSLGLFTIFFKFDLLIFKYFGYKNYIFTKTPFILIVGFTIKFLSIAYNSYEQTYSKISLNIFEASFLLNKNPIKTFFLVDFWFLIKKSKFIVLLVLLEIFKELTLSFTLSPFNFRTISMEIYHYNINEMQQISYVPSLMIVFICIICIIFLERDIKYDKNKKFNI